MQHHTGLHCKISPFHSNSLIKFANRYFFCHLRTTVLSIPPTPSQPKWEGIVKKGGESQPWIYWASNIHTEGFPLPPALESPMPTISEWWDGSLPNFYEAWKSQQPFLPLPQRRKTLLVSQPSFFSFPFHSWFFPKLSWNSKGWFFIALRFQRVFRTIWNS